MIIDFNFPTLTPQGWNVAVHKSSGDDIRVEENKFKSKDEAFKFYDQIRQQWQNQRSR